MDRHDLEDSMHDASSSEGPTRAPYEPPAIEDLDTSDGPSVTAAIAPTQAGAAPRRL